MAVTDRMLKCRIFINFPLVNALHGGEGCRNQLCNYRLLGSRMSENQQIHGVGRLSGAEIASERK